MNRIVYQTESGGVAVIIPAESVELALKDVPEGVPYEIVDEADIPSDRYFRNAWVMGDCCIEHDLDKCKAIGHDLRRQQRAEEFKSLDEAIAKRLPGTDEAAIEMQRQAVRDKYSQMQRAIDEAQSPERIKGVLS